MSEELIMLKLLMCLVLPNMHIKSGSRFGIMYTVMSVYSHHHQKTKKKQRFGDFSTSIVNKQPYLNCLIVGNEWHEKSMVCLCDAVLEVQWQ